MVNKDIERSKIFFIIRKLYLLQNKTICGFFEQIMLLFSVKDCVHIAFAAVPLPKK